MSEIILSVQETSILNYLENRSGKDVSWEELAQFSKTPHTVKLKTIKKVVSEIRRKYQQAGLPPTFQVNFVSLAPPAPAAQNLVQVKRTPGGNIIPSTSTKSAAQIDFSVDSLGFRRVKTRSGTYQLNDSEWDMFKYFYNNVGRLVPISELRDKLVYPNYGSKLPARWFDAIMRVINNLRRQVDGLDKRLLTVKGTETSYLFQ